MVIDGDCQSYQKKRQTGKDTQRTQMPKSKPSINHTQMEAQQGSSVEEEALQMGILPVVEIFG